jgi:phenylacetate-CoA ligase
MKSLLERLKEHPDAPAWNHAAGDRLVPSDRSALARFAEALARERSRREPGEVPEAVLRWVRARAPKVPAFRKALSGLKPARDWAKIPTLSREDVAVRPHELVPDDADLAKMLVYRTAGTTGHALLVPHAARAAGAYLPLLELALSRHGVRLRHSPKATSAFLVGAQARTVTYPCALSYWDGGGFAKLNLNPGDWPAPESAARYFAEFAPQLLTGDPLSFAEMLRQGVRHRPKALVTTAVALSRGLKRRLERAYGCPVVDWYSLTETGPLGYACPKGHGYHHLPHDVHLEALRPDGTLAAPGERGEIAVTGGRNPFLPLLRYRTGDWGRLDFGRCPCGDPMPRLLDLEGRAPVVFRRADGSPVNPVDVSRVLREFPLVQHELLQRRGGAVELTVRPLGSAAPLKALRAALAGLFGPGVVLRVRASKTLGLRDGGKTVPYRSELLEE